MCPAFAKSWRREPAANDEGLDIDRCGVLEEPRGGQERKQDSEDDPDINAHQSSPAAALPTNSSLTHGIYFDDLVAQAPERKPVPSSPRNCRDVAHAHFNPRRHPQSSAQLSRRRLSRTALL